MSLLKKFAESRRGNIAMMFAIASIPIIGGVAMALEYSNLSSERAKLQSSIDAAVLFSGKYLDEKGVVPSDQVVLDFVETNFEYTVSSVTLAQVGGNLVLTVDHTVDAFFFGKAYPDAFDQTVTASVPIGGKSLLEIALVLDNTGSMDDDGKMETLISVADSFVTKLGEARDAKNTIEIGLVPFSDYVNVGTGNSSATWLDVGNGSWNGCVGSRQAPYTLKDGSYNNPIPRVDASCPQALQPLTDSTGNLKTQISNMSPNGWTYIAEGVMWGLRVLSPSVPFNQGKPLGSQAAGVNHQKIMVVLTDGDNTRAPKLPSSPLHTNSDQDLANANTEAACAEARNAGVTVYTIVFGTDVSNTGKQVMIACAGDESRYFAASSAAELQGAFLEILSELVTLRLSS